MYEYLRILFFTKTKSCGLQLRENVRSHPAMKLKKELAGA